MEVLAPPLVDDARVDARVWGPRGRLGHHAWEQLSLPLAAHGRPVLSLANTAPLLPRRSAVMVFDLAQRVRPEWFPRELRLYGWAVLAAARSADVVLTGTRAVAGELTDAGVPAARIRVIRLAVDEDLRPAPAAAVADVRRRLKLDRPYAVHVGWANPQKDVGTAVGAHLRVAGRIPHDLVLVGAGHPTFGPVSVPRTASIRMPGYIAESDLAPLLTGAAALLVPSLYEGFGLPALEAIRCGTPALVSDIPSLRESTAGSAVLLPPGDVAAWARALEAALRGETKPGVLPSWTWADAGLALVDALRPLL